jgi:type IV pilus assembly protein PilM
MFFGRKDTIGLDIGSSHLKVVHIKEKKGAYELDAFEIMPLPPELVVEGSIIDSLRLVESIRELMKLAKVKTKNCVLGIAGHASVIIRRISLPEMSEEELVESIKFEAEQHIPFDIDDVNIDFQILGPLEDEPGQMDVMLVACKKDIINEYTSVVREAGLSPVVVDVNAFCIANAYEINNEIEPDRTVALVNIGASTINLNILKGGLTVFTRDSAIGSNIHTEALQKEFGLEYEAAEDLKKGEDVDGATPADATMALEQASEEIVGEIARSIEYYQSSGYMEEIHEVVLSGGGSMIPGFSELLAQSIGLEVILSDPFKNIQIPAKFDVTYIEEMGPIATVAMGLAMRRLGDR